MDMWCSAGHIIYMILSIPFTHSRNCEYYDGVRRKFDIFASGHIGKSQERQEAYKFGVPSASVAGYLICNVSGEAAIKGFGSAKYTEHQQRQQQNMRCKQTHAQSVSH